jgi:hypothetical protein
METSVQGKGTVDEFCRSNISHSRKFSGSTTPSTAFDDTCCLTDSAGGGGSGSSDSGIAAVQVVGVTGEKEYPSSF